MRRIRNPVYGQPVPWVQIPPFLLLALVLAEFNRLFLRAFYGLFCGIFRKNAYWVGLTRVPIRFLTYRFVIVSEVWPSCFLASSIPALCSFSVAALARKSLNSNICFEIPAFSLARSNRERSVVWLNGAPSSSHTSASEQILCAAFRAAIRVNTEDNRPVISIRNRVPVLSTYTSLPFSRCFLIPAHGFVFSVYPHSLPLFQICENKANSLLARTWPALIGTFRFDCSKRLRVISTRQSRYCAMCNGLISSSGAS